MRGVQDQEGPRPHQEEGGHEGPDPERQGGGHFAAFFQRHRAIVLAADTAKPAAFSVMDL